MDHPGDWKITPVHRPRLSSKGQNLYNKQYIQGIPIPQLQSFLGSLTMLIITMSIKIKVA